MSLTIANIKLEFIPKNDDFIMKHYLKETKFYKMLCEEYGQTERLQKYNEDIIKLTEELERDIRESCKQLYNDNLSKDSTVVYVSESEELDIKERSVIKNQLINFLVRENKATAKIMSKELEIDKHKINRVLYGDDAFVRDEKYNWKLKK